MANGSDLLQELKEYADDAGKALPAKLFQNVMIRAMVRQIDDNIGINNRLVDIEKRHCDEDKKAEKKDSRGWEVKLMAIGLIASLIMSVLGLK